MSDPRLACVVMSLANEPGLPDAVRSLTAQQPAVEIVVVNSGGGDPTATLRAAGLDVRVVNRAERLLPGAARNAGIDATQAPYVAFLAADCQAEPGWAAGRLREHDAGAGAVASSVVNMHPASPAAAAAGLLMHHRRATSGKPRRIDLYGCSYDRDLFDRHGRFRDDLRAGEDTEFNRRLPDEVRIAWAPDVRCAVRYPVTVEAMVRDQWTRGRVQARAAAQMFDRPLTLKLVDRTLRNARPALAQALRSPGEGDARPPALAAALVPVAALARAAGVVAERRRPGDGAPRTTVVGILDRDSWEGDTDNLVVVDAARRTLTWIPRDLWCDEHRDRVNQAFKRGGHVRLRAALAELGFQVDAGVCLQRSAVEAAVAELSVTVPVPERIDLRYPLTPRSMLQDGEKVVSFRPPEEALSGERIHQWIGARTQVGKPGSDLIRLQRQQVLVRRLVEIGWDFRRALADPRLVSLSRPDALAPLSAVGPGWSFRIAGGFAPATIDGKAVLVPQPLSRRTAALARRVAARSRDRLSGTRSRRPAASATPDRAARNGAGAPGDPRAAASPGGTAAGPRAGTVRASGPGAAP